jgi:cytochrome P450
MCSRNMHHVVLPKLTFSSLAYAEMRLLLAKMLWHFDFELEQPEEDWYGSLKVFMVWERGNLRVRLTPIVR